MKQCLICRKTNVTFKKPEHIIPQGLVVTHLVLRGIVCDNCNQRFGRTLDWHLTRKSVVTRFNTGKPLVSKSLGENLSRNDALKRATMILRGENKTAFREDKMNQKVILVSTDESTGKCSIYGSRLEVKYDNGFLYALDKIALEYLAYVSSKKNVSIENDPIVSQICRALHEYTKKEKVGMKQANQRANEFWPVDKAGAAHTHIMQFYLNGIYRKMSVADYIQEASSGRCDEIIYWMQVVNTQGYVGVLIALGKIKPFLALVGSKVLAQRLGLIYEGQTLEADRCFKL